MGTDASLSSLVLPRQPILALSEAPFENFSRISTRDVRYHLAFKLVYIYIFKKKKNLDIFRNSSPRPLRHFGDVVSLCSPVWPETHSVDQVGFELKEIRLPLPSEYWD